MFCGSHSGLKRRTSRAEVELTDTAPQAAHLRLRGTVTLAPVKPKTHEFEGYNSNKTTQPGAIYKRQKR